MSSNTKEPFIECFSSIYHAVHKYLSNMKLLTLIQNIIDIFITLGCFTFVLWQGEKCLSKFIENRTTATLQMKNVQNYGTENLYPAFTICPLNNPGDILHAYFITYNGLQYNINTTMLKLHYFRDYSCYTIGQVCYLRSKLSTRWQSDMA